MSIIGNGVMPGGTEDDWMVEQYLTGTIKEAYSDEVERIRDQAFYNCSTLTIASFPNASYIGSSAFYNCSALTIASFPNASYIESSAFYSCTSLTTASFPNASYIGNSAFYNCKSLTTVSFPNASYIGRDAFRNCASLTAFYLPGESLCTLANRNVFQNTPLLGDTATGYIYVPFDLVATYQVTTNWSYFSSRISAIS